MKKKLLFFVAVLITFLFTGCLHKNTEEKSVLIIKNQSSFSIKDIKYSNQTVSFLSAGENCKLQLVEEANGYVYFTLCNEIKNIFFPVRTNETISVEKIKTATFIITDNTLVIERGKTQPIRIYDLMKIAILKVCNKTSFDILEISYGGNINKSLLTVGDELVNKFNEPMKDELSIKILRKKDSAVINVTLKDEITLKIGKFTEVMITNKTLVVEEGKTEVRELRRVLDMATITITNKTTAQSIFKVKFLESIYEAVLPQNSSCEFDFTDSIEDHIHFSMESVFGANHELGVYNVKTKDKISLVQGEEKIFTLTDDTLIVIEDSPPSKISSLIYAAGLEITNASSAELLNVTYNNSDNHNSGSLPINTVTSVVYWDCATGQYPISFEIKNNLGNIIKVKTVETIALRNKEIVSFVITDNTPVIFEASGRKALIRDILGIVKVAGLNFINLCNAVSISTITFAERFYQGILPFRQSYHFVCEYAVDDYIYFTLTDSFDNHWYLKTSDRINVGANENKTFVLNNNTLAFYENHEIYLHNLIYAAQLRIENNFDKELLNVTYNDLNCGTLQYNSVSSHSIWGHGSEFYPVNFEIKTCSGKKIKLTTIKKQALKSQKSTSFIITGDTLVMIENSETARFLQDIYDEY